MTVSRQQVPEERVQVPWNLPEFPPQLSSSPALVVLLVQDAHNEDDPHKDTSGLFVKIYSNLFAHFTSTDLQLFADVGCDILGVAFLPLQDQLKALIDGDVWVVPTGKENVE